MTKAWFAATVVTLGACQCQDAGDVAGPDAGFTIQPNLKLTWNRGLPAIPATHPTPEAYQKAQLAWRTATVAFSYGNYPGAADAFVEVTGLLSDEATKTSTPALANTQRAARCMAYQNAAAAWRGVPDGPGKDRLKKALAEDSACEHSIRRALLRLTTATSSTATTSGV